ncbi:YfhO family protein [Apilactobacillus quenuiae]|uniref:YfhO family protein n=1 Tax=Apilactobacillus quenuiae TaxID=2008377 RepID=UPI000D01DA2F|nr:YfhO family protein [Apilactobacillus quenuiae]
MIKIKRMTKLAKHNFPLILSFFTPFIIMACYFAYRNMFPFGNGSILTVDLGQQYVDFFAFYRRTILNLNIHNFFYSFSNGYGGEMIGIWSYYLMSPLNLIIAILPKGFMNGSLLLITLLKYGLSGLSFGYMLNKKGFKKNLVMTAFATAYSLNGWIIANQLNIIWLDAMILLPIIILGIDNIINNDKYKLYILSLSIMIIVNYYMAYMICIFSLLYFITNYVVYYKSKIKSKYKIIIKYIGASLTALLLSAWIIIPNIIELRNGKASYTNNIINWRLEYNPINMVSKLMNGAFNFEQMPSGYPNIFVGSLVLISVLTFFFNHRIKLKVRLLYLSLTFILLVSMCFEPLDLIWHAFQFPIWYPYRFSFIFCFLITYLGVIGFNNLPNKIDNKITIKISIIVIIMLLIVGIRINSFTFLSSTKYVISVLIIAVMFVIVISSKINNPKWYIISIFIITCCDMGINAFNSLNSISYVNNSDYISYNKVLNENINKIKRNDKTFYRINKNFYRTQDDPMELGFSGGSIFSSTMNKNNANFNSKIGNPYNTGSINYSNGTLVTDSLLRFKYFLSFNNNYKKYPMIQKSENRYDILDNRKKGKSFDIKKNNLVLPLIFSTNKDVKNTIKTTNPIEYQNEVVKQISSSNKNIFNADNNYKVNFNNVYNTSSLNQAILKKIDPLKNASIEIKYHYSNGHIPYIVLPNNLGPNICSVFVDGEKIISPKNFQNSLVYSLPKKNGNIDIKFKKQSIFTSNFGIYNLNYRKFKHDISKIKNQNIKFNNQNIISTNINLKRRKNLLTSIPYSDGWHVKIDNKEYNKSTWLREFISIKNIKKGKHHVELYYYPKGLNLGIIITFLTIAFFFIKTIVHKKRK